MSYKIIYAITTADANVKHEGEISTIEHDGLLALVQETDKLRQRPSRKNVLRHQAIIERVMTQGYPVLPMRFGTVAESAEGVVDHILVKQAGELNRLLAYVTGKHEVGLRVNWPEADLLAEVTRRAPDLLKAASTATEINEKINIGQQVAAVNQQIHDDLTDAFLTIIKDFIADYRLHDRAGDTESLNAAFLIEDKNQVGFDAALDVFSRDYPDGVLFKLITPLPAYSFVDLTINLEDD